MQLSWGSQDHGRITENVPMQAGINDSRELQIEMDEDPCGCHLHKQHHYRCSG
jgi:hypothetical protein